MSLALDPVIEARIQRELSAGRFTEPSELIAHALDLVEAERQDLISRRAQLIARLEESCAQADRGEGFTEEQLRARMAERRASHPQSRTV